jgi:vacuolar-type H+-ATPase subunit I/STV1
MKQKSSRAGDWRVQAVLAGFGLCLMLFGYFEYKHGYFWHVSFSERFARAAFTPALSLIAFGAFLFLLGILPWQRISDWLERRDAKRRK